MMAEMVEPGWSNVQADCRRVFEDNSQPMWVVDAVEVVDVNRAALLHYGYSRDEFLALTIGVLSGERPASDKVTPDPHSLSRHRRKDGTSIDVEVTSFPVTFAGRPASLASIPDVTYRRRTEAQTRYLDFLLATVNDAVVASDEQVVLTAWSAAAESTYGRSAEEVLGLSDALVCRTDFVGVDRTEAIKRLLETGRFQGELTHRRKDGKRIHLESRAAALFDSDGKRLGYVSVNRDVTERRFADETIRALWIDVLTAQEAERRRVASELQDETAQTLASLLVGLKAVYESKDLGQAMEAAGVLRGLVSAALEGVQRIARGLRPSVLDDLGLVEALDRLGLEVSRARAFVVEVDSTGARLPRLPEALETTLYRMAQEALMNASKHASPKAVSILIHRNPTEVRLVVEDDGKGFDVTEALAGARLGLLGMRERAHLPGGAMTVESSIGSGTTICVSVPLARHSSPS